MYSMNAPLQTSPPSYFGHVTQWMAAALCFVPAKWYFCIFFYTYFPPLFSLEASGYFSAWLKTRLCQIENRSRKSGRKEICQSRWSQKVQLWCKKMERVNNRAPRAATVKTLDLILAWTLNSAYHKTQIFNFLLSSCFYFNSPLQHYCIFPPLHIFDCRDGVCWVSCLSHYSQRLGHTYTAKEFCPSPPPVLPSPRLTKQNTFRMCKFTAVWPLTSLVLLGGVCCRSVFLVGLQPHRFLVTVWFNGSVTEGLHTQL